MENGTGTVWPWLLHVRTVQGEPYRVGERVLIPVAKLVSWGKAKGQIGNDSYGGWAGGFVRVIPVAVLEQTSDGERRIALTDGTALALQRLLIATVTMTLGFAVIRWMAHKWRRAGGES
jgi:uncharacterized spore protein YtfJ